tara:strand:- start:341 stop:688 length:348 start_codon:yes stop_codon:yes gene_type:complete
MDFKYVYKICTNEEWEVAKKRGKYEGSKKDKEDGFIHFSDKEQLKETLNKFFFKQKNLILLKIDAFKLKNLIYEQVSDGNVFPHLYEPFEISNVINEYKIELSENGSHNIPSEIN